MIILSVHNSNLIVNINSFWKYQILWVDTLNLLYVQFNPLTPNDFQRRRAVSHLKIKIPSKILARSVGRRDLIPA
jgi:hypothetical protein